MKKDLKIFALWIISLIVRLNVFFPLGLNSWQNKNILYFPNKYFFLKKWVFMKCERFYN